MGPFDAWNNRGRSAKRVGEATHIVVVSCRGSLSRSLSAFFPLSSLHFMSRAHARTHTFSPVVLTVTSTVHKAKDRAEANIPTFLDVSPNLPFPY